MNALELLPPENTDLSKQINDLHEKVTLCHKRSREHLCQGLVAAWKAGGMLIEQKQRVKHGNWEFWLKHNFRGSSRTALRYMVLAKSATDVTVFEDMSLRQAYLHCGISMDSSSKETAPQHEVRLTLLPPYLTTLDKLVRDLRKKGRPDELPEAEVEALRRDLRPLHEWIQLLYVSETVDGAELTGR